MNKILIGILILVALAGIGLGIFLPKPTQPTPGVASGTDHYNPETFWAGFGGKALATSTTQATQTLTEKNLTDYTYFAVTPNNKTGLTWTLPATTTLSSLLRSDGDTKQWIFQIATTSTGIDFTLAKGTGWNLVGVDANVDVLPGAAWGAQELLIMTCVRQPDKDIGCELRENIAAD